MKEEKRNDNNTTQKIAQNLQKYVIKQNYFGVALCTVSVFQKL